MSFSDHTDINITIPVFQLYSAFHNEGVLNCVIQDLKLYALDDVVEVLRFVCHFLCDGF